MFRQTSTESVVLVCRRQVNVVIGIMIGSALLPTRISNRSSVRFGKVQVRTVVQNWTWASPEWCSKWPPKCYYYQFLDLIKQLFKVVICDVTLEVLSSQSFVTHDWTLGWNGTAGNTAYHICTPFSRIWPIKDNRASHIPSDPRWSKSGTYGGWGSAGAAVNLLFTVHFWRWLNFKQC